MFFIGSQDEWWTLRVGLRDILSGWRRGVVVVRKLSVDVEASHTLTAHILDQGDIRQFLGILGVRA